MASLKKNVEWATTIKNHHNKIRSAVTSNQSSAVGTSASASIDESYDRWRQQRDTSSEELRAYANAMHDLGTKFWAKGGGVGVTNDTNISVGGKRSREEDGNEVVTAEVATAASTPQEQFSATTGRYDDRVEIVVDAVNEFYFGTFEVVNKDSNTLQVLKRTKLPVIISKMLRSSRKEYFDIHGKQLPEDQEASMCEKIILEGNDCMTVLTAPAYAAVEAASCESGVATPIAAASPSSAPTIELRVLDVGSCYGPYRGFFDKPDGLPFKVAATHVDIDLCPYEGSGVLQCDWLECKFQASNLELTSKPHTERTRALVALPESSFHVVILCFMLSYLPTREMRLRACFNALRALMLDGLLCIVSTRTQGPRSGKWIEPWTACIEGLGFRLAQKVIKSKVILLTFQKTAEVPTHQGGEAAASSLDPIEDYYRATMIPLLEKYPEGMSLHEQSM